MSDDLDLRLSTMDTEIMELIRLLAQPLNSRPAMLGSSRVKQLVATNMAFEKCLRNLQQ
jgi:hypothetical protein